MDSQDTWSVKLASWLHDPAEKALILLRGVPHEKFTVDKVLTVCFPRGVPDTWERIIRLADRWAAAADRPTMPLPTDERRPDWVKVKFWDRDQAEIIHPLSGRSYALKDLYQDSWKRMEELSLGTYLDLIAPQVEGERKMVGSPREAFLTLWRLLPERDPLGLGYLWSLLPADTRTPWHTIWDHLSLTSAIAGAMASDPEGNVGLILVSIGPVQSFLQKARSTSDLWAGSHLLSFLSWRAMEVVCDKYGPDAIIYPKLWGVPMVDVWLEKNGVSFKDLGARWRESSSDSNPLFVAALPNQFVALVPANEAKSLGSTIARTVRGQALEMAKEAAKKLVEETGQSLSQTMLEQVEAQLKDFPEVQWALVPFRPFVTWDEEGSIDGMDMHELAHALSMFFPADADELPGFLGSDQWKLLRRPLKEEKEFFVYRPNPGVLYPALYQLLDRVHSAAKEARLFHQLEQGGFRCSMCGEMEWLTHDRAQLALTSGKRRDTTWFQIGQKRPAWARKGEHLCAICATKRLWPDIFRDWVQKEAGLSVDRFVVSTHTMALGTDLLKLLERDDCVQALSVIHDWKEDIQKAVQAAMPLKLHKELRRRSLNGWESALRKLPGFLDQLRERESSDDPKEAEGARRKREEFEKGLDELLGHKPEAYYAILLMDGDNMGAWVSGTHPAKMVKYEELFHSRVREGLRSIAAKDVKDYLSAVRSPSPAYHGSISSALNGFALYAVPYIVEELYLGKLIYAGGDDVLALLCVDDCLEAAVTLRCAFSGTVPAWDKHAVWNLLRWLDEQRDYLKAQVGRGFVRVNKRLFHVMGESASASAGLVVAHHTAPLQMVLREARKAERMAKSQGRDSLAITLIKRSGGATQVVVPFGLKRNGDSHMEVEERLEKTPVGALLWLRDILARQGMSRRAAYHVLQWLSPLSGTGEAADFKALLSKNLAWQLQRQWSGSEDISEDIKDLGEALAEVSLSMGSKGRDPVEFLRGLFQVAEFLAREGRARSVSAK
jgi:CRISPR-associated protein Cmr2